MSTAPPSGDPLQMMRDAYAQGVERWSQVIGEIVGSEDFAAASGQLLALYAQQQQSARAASRAVAEAMQVPTTEDLAAVAQLVINVERKLDEVSDQSAEIVRRLAALEGRLEKLLAEPPRRAKPAAAKPAVAKPAAAKPAAAKPAPRARRTPPAGG